MGTADEAAAVLEFLISKDAALINGTVITADGGWASAAGTCSAPGKSWFEN